MQDLIVFSGSSHPEFVDEICKILNIKKGDVNLGKFSNKETRVEINLSVRNKNIFIIQSGCGFVNDNVIELLIMISACKTASAKKVTAVLPCFPYSRQPDILYTRNGAKIMRLLNYSSGLDIADDLLIDKDSVKFTPPQTSKKLDKSADFISMNKNLTEPIIKADSNELHLKEKKLKDEFQNNMELPQPSLNEILTTSQFPTTPLYNKSIPNIDDYYRPTSLPNNNQMFRHWTANTGTLIAGLLEEAGADCIITMDLHDSQFQGFFNVPVDMLYAEPTILKYIKDNIPDYKKAVIVSPDAGGAKRATSIAKRLNLKFALIHKELNKKENEEQRKLMLVGDVKDKVTIIIDDIADTCGTIGYASQLLHKKGARSIHAIVTHGILSGPALDVINLSPLDSIAITNTIPQEELKQKCNKLKIIDVSQVFAESIRRVYFGESLTQFFQD